MLSNESHSLIRWRWRPTFDGQDSIIAIIWVRVRQIKLLPYRKGLSKLWLLLFFFVVQPAPRPIITQMKCFFRDHLNWFKNELLGPIPTVCTVRNCQNLNVDADYTSYIMEYMVCMQKTAHKDMIMKSHLNYNVLQRANRDQGFDFAVLQTLTSEDSENHVSCGKHFK